MSKDTTPKLPSVIRDKCGTTAGHAAHKRNKETPCEDCRLARKAYCREYRKKNLTEIKSKSKKYREKNIEKNRAYSKAWRLANPDKVLALNKAYRLANTEKRRAYSREYQRANPEKTKITHKAWRLANPEKVKATNKSCTERFNLLNPEKSRIYRRQRRARKLNAPSEPYTTQDILDLWGTNCHICGEAIDLNAPRRTCLKGWERGLHLEHVIPLARGGSDLKENVKPSHGICNQMKWRD